MPTLFDLPIELLIRICEDNSILDNPAKYTRWIHNRIVCKKIFDASYEAYWAKCSISADFFPRRYDPTNSVIVGASWPRHFRSHARLVHVVMHVLIDNLDETTGAMLAYLEQVPNGSVVTFYLVLEGDLRWKKDEVKEELIRAVGCLEMERGSRIRVSFGRISWKEEGSASADDAAFGE